MNAEKCQALLTAAERSSITAAGEALGYTQSGITRMIRSLEDELGFPLLVRTKKGVTLTPNGEAMLPSFREIVRAGRVASETGAEIRGAVSGVLTIGGYYSVSSIWMPSIFKSYLKRYPGVRIILREGGNREMTRWLNERSVDLCFSGKPSADAVCDWMPLRDDELVVWLPKGHPRAMDAAYPIKELENEAFITTLQSQDTDIDRFLAAECLSPDIRFSTADVYTTYRMVEEGLGVSLNNRLTTSRWNGDVVLLPFDPPRYISLGIAVPSMNELSPAAKRFVECAGNTSYI
jgi:DNA-binding transcriptional LysR family regulator